MRENKLGVAGLLFLWLLSGCSSEQSTKQASQDAVPPTVVVKPISQASNAASQSKPINEQIVVSNDSLIAIQLEQARQHYLTASRAEENDDTLRAARQFESSLEILDALSYYPAIESNQDYNDLSKSIVEDYERFIRKTGIIDSTSSIFALREKLNIITEQFDTVAAVQPTRVVPGAAIPLVVNGLVERSIEFFTNRGRSHMEVYLQRSGKFFPMMKRIMREEGVPEDIVYLAMVESGLNPVARSWARAVGIWQFIHGTGSLYGLKRNFWYDERRDFELATRAAARHLRDLYEDFDDWYLVMAAYNSGAGNVYRAMRRSGSNDFWEMRRFLPRETRNYVPSYIAVAIIGLSPQEYGFDVEIADSLDYDYVTVNECLDLEVLAECAGTNEQTLRDLNPALIHGCTPPTDAYRLRIPAATDKETFKQKYAELPASKRVFWFTHVVKRGETLTSLARKYGVSASVLTDANDLSTRRRLRRGTKLMVPIAKAGKAPRSTETLADIQPETKEPVSIRTQARRVRSEESSTAGKTKLTYKVKRGDTIGHIAEWYNVRATDIRNWNNHPFGKTLRAGTTLTIWVDKEDLAVMKKVNSLSLAEKLALNKQQSTREEAESSTEDAAFVYLVRSGDTLDEIAREHGVSVKQIQRWNGMRSTRLMPGKKLTLYPSIKTVESHAERKLETAKSAAKGKANDIIYVVRKGDTISRIAQEHDVAVSQLRAWNSLTNKNRIFAGQELIIKKETY